MFSEQAGSPGRKCSKAFGRVATKGLALLGVPVGLFFLYRLIGEKAHALIDTHWTEAVIASAAFMVVLAILESARATRRAYLAMVKLVLSVVMLLGMGLSLWASVDFLSEEGRTFIAKQEIVSKGVCFVQEHWQNLSVRQRHTAEIVGACAFAALLFVARRAAILAIAGGFIAFWSLGTSLYLLAMIRGAQHSQAAAALLAFSVVVISRVLLYPFKNRARD